MKGTDHKKVSVLFVYQAEESMTMKKTFEKRKSIYSKNEVPDIWHEKYLKQKEFKKCDSQFNIHVRIKIWDNKGLGNDERSIAGNWWIVWIASFLV